MRCILRLLVSYLVRPCPSWAQAKKVKISEGFYILGVGDQERSYFGVIRLVSSSIDYEPPSRGLSRSGDHGQVCVVLCRPPRAIVTSREIYRTLSNLYFGGVRSGLGALAGGSAGL